MRKIKSNFFISLDGVVESPDKWHFSYFNDQIGAAIGAGAAGVDAYLMGRVLYEEWAAYWPEHADEPSGDVLNATKKYVLSSTVTSAEWENSEILSGDVASKLAELKAQEGSDIAMSGSATTVRWLLRQRLLDELHLLVHRSCRRGHGATLSARRAADALRAPQLRDVRDGRPVRRLRAGEVRAGDHGRCLGTSQFQPPRRDRLTYGAHAGRARVSNACRETVRIVSTCCGLAR